MEDKTDSELNTSSDDFSDDIVNPLPVNPVSPTGKSKSVRILLLFLNIFLFISKTSPFL